MRKTQLILVVLLVLALQACAPRGETRTLNQVLTSAKDRYARVTAIKDGSSYNKLLDEVVDAMDELVVGGPRQAELTARVERIDQILSQLVDVAGYPSRPAMGELIDQYRAVSRRATESGLSLAQLKLLVARTYNLLAVELETTKFAVS